MSNKEIDKLLDLLKANPHFVRDIVFHSKNIQAVLGKNAACGDLSGVVSATQFLDYIACAQDGHPIAYCSGGTKSLCAKGTRVSVENQTRRRKMRKRST